jgi:hypothetical protein
MAAPDDSESDSSILGLGLTVADIKVEDSLRWIVRRLAQVTVELKRIADVQELQLKFQLVQANLSLSALKGAEYEGSAAPAGDKPAMEVLQQTPEELAEINQVAEDYERRFGKLPLELDLYAEKARMEADNPEEAP